MSSRGWLLFGAMGIIWGIPYLLIKVSVDAVGPASLVFARTAIGAAVLMPIAVVRGHVRPVLQRWRPLLLFTVAELAVPWVLLSYAEERLASSLSGLLVAAVPLAAVLLDRLSGSSERLSRLRALGLVVGLAGVATLVGLDVRRSDLLSVLAIGVVVLGYSTGPLVLSRSLSDLPSLGVLSLSLGLTAVAYLPVAIATQPAKLPPPSVTAAILTLGLICTALGFLLFFELIDEVGPVRATVVAYVNPAVAVLLGVVFLGEPFTAAIAAGFVLVIAGSVLAGRQDQRATKAHPAR
ncbi:MAG: EamA family transporter [Actinomycetota bacterium]|nr:EamA family transporter [Actinomycetota bacterium]